MLHGLAKYFPKMDRTKLSRPRRCNMEILQIHTYMIRIIFIYIITVYIEIRVRVWSFLEKMYCLKGFHKLFCSGL